MPNQIQVKSVLNKHKKRDSWFLDDYSANFYSGCTFNCLYCYIRGSKYGENLAEKQSIKVNGLEIFEKQLKRRAEKKEYGFIVLSSITDPYLPLEEEYKLTQSALKIILKYRFPVHIITKSTLVERDFSLLMEIDKQAILPKDLSPLGRGCILTLSYSTVNQNIGQIFEPGAPSPKDRLEIQKKAKILGLYTGVSLMPLLPFITDTKDHLNVMFSKFKQADVDYILPATLGLYGRGKYDSKTLVLKAVGKHYPELLNRYLGYYKNSHQLPQFYRDAYKSKMKSLCKEFGIQNSIMGD